tara:strand:+ start:3385 stop:3870 length:486 start_codon:yes stop_codon:yes gene_type:complete
MSVGNIRKVLLAIDNVLTRAGSGVACILLGVAVAIGAFQVLSRFILEEPSPWSEALVRMLIIWAIYLGVCGTIRAGAMISVDALYSVAAAGPRKLMRGTAVVSMLVLFGLLLFYGIKFTYFVRGQTMAGVNISMSWAYLAIPTGAFLAIFAVLASWARQTD